MPSSAGPNTAGDSNLAFAYDLGDTVNSFKGEPATNYHDYDKSVMNQTGFDNWSCYDGNPPYHTWGIHQSKTFVTLPGPDGKDTTAMLYYNFDGGFYGPTDWSGIPAAICTSGNQITIQGWVKAADAASVGLVVTPYTYFSLNNGGVEATSTNWTLTANWQLVSHTHTLSSAATNTTNILYFFTSNGSSPVRMYLTKTAVISGKGHAVQWLPGGTTRSVSGSLVTEVGSSTIDLTDVSFDSTAQMTFDGTNDKIYGINSIVSYLSSSAIEFIVTPTTVNKRMTVGGYRQNDGYSQPTIGMVYIQDDNTFNASVITTTQVYRAVTSTTTITANKTYHVVFNKDTSAGLMQLYVNGVLESTQTFDPNTYAQWATTGSYIGSNLLDLGKSNNTNAGQGWSSDFLAGKIPIFKLYSRTLLPSEVAQNYRAYKTRFNLA